MIQSESDLGVREVARRLGVHENTVRNWSNQGILRIARRLPGGGFRRFRATDVEDLKKVMERAGEAP